VNNLGIVESLQKIKKIYFAAAMVLLYSLNVAGQEPVDSMTISKYTESDIIYISDTTDLTILFPLDTLSMYSTHSPAKAAIMSAVLPGLGQIYNKKYWKLPIVYAAIGISAERFIFFQNEFNRYRRAYIDINDGDPNTNFHKTLGFPPSYSEEQMRQPITKRKEMLRTWRDYAIVAIVASYALNIIDANVDAHLMDFSLDDNISLNIRPCFLGNDVKSKKIGLSLQFTF